MKILNESNIVDWTGDFVNKTAEKATKDAMKFIKNAKLANPKYLHGDKTSILIDLDDNKYIVLQVLGYTTIDYTL